MATQRQQVGTAKIGTRMKIGHDWYVCDFVYTAAERATYGANEVCGSLPRYHYTATTRAATFAELVVNDAGRVCVAVRGGGYREVQR